MVLKNKAKEKRHKAFKAKNVRVAGYYSILFAIILVLIDRISKVWATNIKSMDLGFLNITYTVNTGGGFSILTGMNAIFIIIGLVASGAIIFYRKYIPRFAAILLFSGIIGNTLDRIFFGGVIDFINLQFWPIFNIADSLIVIGVAVWIITILKESKTKQ